MGGPGAAPGAGAVALPGDSGLCGSVPAAPPFVLPAAPARPAGRNRPWGEREGAVGAPGVCVCVVGVGLSSPPYPGLVQPGVRGVEKRPLW